MHEIIDIAVRSLAVYLFIIFSLRLFGKSQLSQLNAGDVVLLLLISNAVQNAMVGPDTSLKGGIAAALVLFLANYLLKRYVLRNQMLRNIVEARPYVLLRDGNVLNEILKKTDITEDELLETIHEHGLEHFKDVKLAILEVDGNISVISMGDKGNTHFTRHKRHIRVSRLRL